MIFVPLINFKHHDNYSDEDLKYGPERPDWVPKKGFLIDFHCHTTKSDGLLTPKQSVLWHISNGYDGMIVSDHNTMDAVNECIKYGKEIDPSFLVIPGYEFTSMNSHLNIIGCKTMGPIPNMLWTTKKKIRSAIAHAHSEGALIQFNHRDWYPHKRFHSKDWYFENEIDGFEVYNGFGFFDDEAEDFIKKNKEKKILFGSAGTDIHDPPQHYRVYTEVLTKDRTINGVIKALKEGNTKVYSNIEEEKKNPRPEKGKKQINQIREKVIQKWKWLNWFGYSIFVKGNKIKPIIFIFIYIGIITTISFMI